MTILRFFRKHALLREQRIANHFVVTTDALLGRTECVSLDVSGLTDEQRGHVALIVRDLSRINQ